MIFLYFASDSFLSRAKVLTDSIKKHHPDDKIVHVNPGNGILGQYIPGLAKQRLEKALELLKTTKESVIIIGADCELFDTVKWEVEISDYDEDVMIVPHVKQPLKDRNYMAQIYKSGHANADFIYFRNSKNGKNILKWLISVTEDGIENGTFYEQTWLSSLPFLFDSVKIIRNPGYNVGYWDINHVDFEFEDGKYFVNDQPLVLFQYSGYVKGEPEKMSRHSHEQAENDAALQIYKEYDARITE